MAEITNTTLGPNCFHMTPQLMKWLPVAIQGAKAIRY